MCNNMMPMPNMMNPFVNMMPFNNMYPYNNMNNYDTNNELNTKISIMERQIKRLDSRVARLESKCNINTSNYQSTNDGYNINENDMYML